MARKSRSQLEMEQTGLISDRQTTDIKLPAELETDEERQLYERIFRANPSSHLFSAAVEPLAVAYVRHYVAANDLAIVIRSIDKVKEPRLFLAMLKSQKDETMALNAIASRLKLGGASIANHRGNLLPTSSERPKPWELDSWH